MGACRGATRSHRVSWLWPSHTARSQVQRARPALGVSQPSRTVNNCGRSAGPSMSSPPAEGKADCRQRTAITAYLQPPRNDRPELSERSHLPPSRHWNAGYQSLQCSVTGRSPPGNAHTQPAGSGHLSKEVPHNNGYAPSHLPGVHQRHPVRTVSRNEQRAGT
jgi:hypothetical protein